MEELGAGEFFINNITNDGVMKGYDLNLINIVTSNTNIPVIASGGAGNLSHLYDALHVGNADAVLAASIFHYGINRISDAKRYLAKRGVAIRPNLE